MNELQDAPFVMVGVNSDDTLERAKRAVEENELNWRSFQNKPAGAEQAISGAWQVRGWPTLVVIDETFTIRYRGHDGHKAGDLAKELARNLKAGS